MTNETFPEPIINPDDELIRLDPVLSTSKESVYTNRYTLTAEDQCILLARLNPNYSVLSKHTVLTTPPVLHPAHTCTSELKVFDQQVEGGAFAADRIVVSRPTETIQLKHIGTPIEGAYPNGKSTKELISAQLLMDCRRPWWLDSDDHGKSDGFDWGGFVFEYLKPNMKDHLKNETDVTTAFQPARRMLHKFIADTETMGAVGKIVFLMVLSAARRTDNPKHPVMRKGTVVVQCEMSSTGNEELLNMRLLTPKLPTSFISQMYPISRKDAQSVHRIIVEKLLKQLLNLDPTPMTILSTAGED